jgi:hypothetical protein
LKAGRPGKERDIKDTLPTHQEDSNIPSFTSSSKASHYKQTNTNNHQPTNNPSISTTRLSSSTITLCYLQTYGYTCGHDVSYKTDCPNKPNCMVTDPVLVNYPRRRRHILLTFVLSISLLAIWLALADINVICFSMTVCSCRSAAKGTHDVGRPGGARPRMLHVHPAGPGRCTACSSLQVMRGGRWSEPTAAASGVRVLLFADATVRPSREGGRGASGPWLGLQRQHTSGHRLCTCTESYSPGCRCLHCCTSS